MGHLALVFAIAIQSADGWGWFSTTTSTTTVVNACCGGAAQFLSENKQGEALGVVIGNENGVCCVIDDGIPPTRPLKFYSSSKMVAAYTILRLVDNGLLSLETRLADLFSWWTRDEGDHRSRVRIKHLLSQVDGFPQFSAGIGR